MLAGESLCRSSLKAGGLALLIIFILTFSPRIAQGQWGDQVERVSESLIWGPYHDVEISDSLVYCAMGYGLAIFDVSDPARMEWLSYYGLPGQTEGLFIEGTTVYVAAGSGGLHILDATDPVSPQFVSRLNLPGYAYEAVKSGDFLYVAAGSGGLRVVNVSQPTNPYVVASLSLGGWAMDLELDGDTLYAAAQSVGLKVINIGNPAQPQIIGEYDTPNGVTQGVRKSGNLLYLSDGPNGVVILNVSAPSQPILVAQWPTGGSVHEAEISGSYLYAADDAVGIVVLDVSDPQDPDSVGIYNSPGLAWSLALDNGTLYTADDAQGLRSLSLANPIRPVSIDDFCYPGEVLSVWAGGGYAYTARGYLNEVTIQDVSVPALPLTVSHAPFNVPVVETNIAGGICYAALLTGGVGLANVSNPLLPHFMYRINTVGESWDMIAQPTLIYVADGSEDLVFLATQQDTAWNLSIPGQSRGLLKRGDTLYVSQWDEGVALVDVTPPTQPQILAQYDTPGLAHRCAVVGNYLYVADDLEGLAILHNGINVGHYATDGDVWDVKLSGSFAFLAAGSSGLIVLDITNPDSPVYAGSYQMPGIARKVFLEGNYIYVASQFCLGIYRFTGSGVSPTSPVMPGEFSLSIRPNPFNATTVLSYELRAASRIRLQVYDLTGKLVKTLVEGFRPAGKHEAKFDGSGLSSGLYFVAMQATEGGLRPGEFRAVRKVVLVK